MTKFGAIGLFGRANAGKSTLVNLLVGEKVSIVSKKPQTTRKRILGILTVDDCQMVFCDTPGLHSIKNKLDKYMNDEIAATLNGLQGGLYLADLSDLMPESDKEYLSQLNPNSDTDIFLVLNKSDLVDENTINQAKETYKELYPFKEIFVVSSKKKKGHLKIINKLKKILISGPFAFDPDYYTNQSEREIAEEIVREAILKTYHQEVPHSVAVQVDEFKERENGKTYISATLYVEKEAHKKIIIGKNGEGIKNLGSVARQKLNEMLERDIFLELWVKVRENWRQNEQWVSRLGYKS
ncbi:MAG: GTPase Era [bacterium ADurb.Bin157]|jgi:GTPase|nr:GTPase Era [Candidatus Riflebacteria bacterium]NCB46208.1 GTPase Era [bacterium]OQB48056.1 MAG: GTPase Era [bacterium ADurb.Bin157]